MNFLEVVRPGVRSTIQDSGRRGYRHHGLTAGGALDLISYTWANKLLDNPRNAACLEIVMGGFHGIARGSLQIAITGAATCVTINGQPVEQWQTLNLNDGDELAIDHSKHHRLVYLAMAGGLDSPEQFGSRSVVVREKLEGLVPVKAGDRLMPLQPERQVPERKVPDQQRPDLDGEAVIRLIPGYQYPQFQRADIIRLTTSRYTVGDQSDRMGFRLQGTPLSAPPPGIISEGIALGSVQIPGDGQPIVLLNDCQTIGGYPKPGVVPTMDCGLLAQQLRGARVRFELCDLATAQNQRRLFELHYQNTRWRQTGQELEWL
ncbi:biotin-dependent carboxyltransferase family protein [Marinobacter sp. NSM]|uniref:biotin-dependent carboxyltransferase family protein n=1 Tax=Marinobacter sp. NSM TaxID=3458004 RepID=UPI004036558E